MTLLDHMLHATRLAGRGVCTVNRTAADDLRDQGFPVDAGAGSGRTAVEDEDLEETKPEAEETDEAKTSGQSDALDEDLDAEIEDEDQKDVDWKKRFVGSQKQHLEDKRRIEEQEARIARLEQSSRIQPVTTTVPQPVVRDETATRLQAELDQIPSTDPDARKKTIEKWVSTSRQIGKEEGRAAAVEVVDQRLAAKENQVTAISLMKEALKKKGLDPEADFELADAKAAHLKGVNVVRDPRDGQLKGRWYVDVPDEKQFDALADLVKADVDRILAKHTKEANVALRKTAEGVVGKGNKGVIKAKSTDKDDVPDRSFTQQQRDVQALRLKEGSRRYAEAGR